MDFSTLQFKLSGSYSKRMSGSRTSANYLVFGAEAGLNQRGVKFHNAIWGTQISSNGIDPNGQKDPATVDPSFLFADVSVGLLWFSVLDKYNNFYFGGAFSHLNEPLQYNIQSATPGYIPAPLYSKLTVHGGGMFELTRRNSIIPGFVAFFPVFCDLQQHEYAWLDKNDKYRPLSLALEHGYWQIVTRSNHFQGRYSDFRDHGAVERMGMILVYRPRSLGDHLRQLPERRHLEISRAAEEGTSGEYYERTLHKGTEVSTGGEVIYAQEQPGEEGLQPTGAFQGKG